MRRLKPDAFRSVNALAAIAASVAIFIPHSENASVRVLGGPHTPDSGDVSVRAVPLKK